jgi:hypothetical protein
MADCYARMAKLAADALDDRARAVELWGRVVDIRGEDANRPGGPRRSPRDGRGVEGADRGPREAGRRHARPDAKIPIYKRLGRIWGEKLSRERNSLESWQKVLELDPQDVDALRAIAANYRSAGAWEELSQSLRRLIQVGQLGGSGIESGELKELFAQLGELEGETLMRTAGLDRRLARGAGARSEPTSARWPPSSACSCRRRAGRRRSTSWSGARGAGQPERPRRRPDAGGVAVGRQDRRRRFGAEVYERVLQIDPGPPARVDELEQLYRQRKSWVKLVDLLLARTEFSPDAATRISLLGAGLGDLRAAARPIATARS